LFYWFLVQWGSSSADTEPTLQEPKNFVSWELPARLLFQPENEVLPGDLQRKTIARTGKLGMKTRSCF
jgi:hypothetical protein